MNAKLEYHIDVYSNLDYLNIFLNLDTVDDIVYS